MADFDLKDYVDVPARLRWFFEKYPEGSLQSDILERGEHHVVVKAVAYRSPADDRPGTGMASEPVPGRTPYTKDSEIMNAETSAWGRALAAIGAPTRDTIASAEEVSSRLPEPSPAAGGISAMPAQDPGDYREALPAEGEAVGDTGPGEEKPRDAAKASPGSTTKTKAKTYPVDPAVCSHKFPSGNWQKWDDEDRCPKCGTPKLVAMEATTADLGPA